MHKKYLGFAAFSLLLTTLVGCGTGTSENDLVKLFNNLKENNFSVEINSSFANNSGRIINQKFYYTDYSLQAEGDQGFIGIAQDDGIIFNYNIVDNSIVSGTPIIDRSTGLRYSEIYDYRKGMESFDTTLLPKEKGSDGWYHYEFGKNRNNDVIIHNVLLNMGLGSIYPKSCKLKVVANTLSIETVTNEYWLDEDGNMIKDFISTTVYEIGSTSNNEIKTYLDTGKTAKKPLDIHFYKTINPYLHHENYTLNIDSTEMIDEKGEHFTTKFTKFITDEAIAYEQNNKLTGYVLNCGVVSSFEVADDKLVITDTPIADTEGNFYMYLLNGEYAIDAYSFMNLDYSTFIGYKDDTADNIYYITDTYFLTVFSYICCAQIHQEMHADYVKIEIIDENTGSFNAYFDFYNKTTNREFGVYKAEFRNYENTSIPVVDRYLNIGDDPNAQEKEELVNALEAFKSHNYTMDYITQSGMARYFYTENYMYVEPYSNYYRGNNYGFIKENGGIYEFRINYTTNEVVVDRTVDYSKGSSAMKLPGVGDFYFANNDLGYISALSDEIYNYDNYIIEYKNGEYYWKNNSTEFSKTVFNYLSSYKDTLPTGSGFIVNYDENEPYDTRVTLVSNIISNDGVYTLQEKYTYYNIGATSVDIIEEYLAN